MNANDGWGSDFKSGWDNEPLGWGNSPSEREPAFNKQSFSIEWDDKIWNVEAIVVGELAVICGQQPFAIMHIHTKSRFDNAIPYGSWTMEELISWCENVQAPDEAKDDFNWLNAIDKADDWSNDENVRARGRILDWCRSVKVK